MTSGASSPDPVTKPCVCGTPPPASQSAPRCAMRINGALLTKNEDRILSWSNDNTLRLWDNRWPRGNLIEVGCALLPNRDLKDISQQYGISIAEPICSPEQISLPVNWLKIER